MPQRGHQAELVQCRRAESLDQPPDLADVLARLVGEARDQVGCLVGVVADQVGRRLQPHREGRQGGSQSVVQVAAEAATFFLACRDEALS